MTIIKTAVVAASLVLVAATANAQQGRGGLESGFHGNTPPEVTAPVATAPVLVPYEARGAFARSGPARVRVPQQR